MFLARFRRRVLKVIAGAQWGEVDRGAIDRSRGTVLISQYIGFDSAFGGCCPPIVH